MQKRKPKPKKFTGTTSTPAERFNLDRTAEVYGDRPLHTLNSNRFSYQEYRKNQEP
ncbi:hypothetical protein [Alcaligenes endophyticus]|uniref:Uncharacterized protein n=1 Tax=Alcaligenes endophyticus TaxID=1929088 RepID=A0ABT8ENI3_9BURK|nr:hypothetical protein [Alcaligenes endophyticus]MCX5592843.1 hypothetical protein [Alcaligenes endophyticus]MDN4122866.1 hypothetical protein [Alcaligenes endophyticus]